MFYLVRLVIPKTTRLDVHWQHCSSLVSAFEIHMDATFFNAALLMSLRNWFQAETLSIDRLFHGLAIRAFEHSLKKDKANHQLDPLSTSNLIHAKLPQSLLPKPVSQTP